MKQFILIAALYSISNLLLAQTSEDLRRLEEFRKKVNAPVVLKPSNTQKMVIKSDLTYTAKEAPEKKLDVYFIDDKRPKALVVLIHGKTPINTNPKAWGVYESWGKLLASEGFVAVTFTHSLAEPGKTLADAQGDLKRAVSYLKSKYNELQFDTTNLALAAYSAGAPLLTSGVQGDIKNVKALVSFYGFLSIAETQLFGQLDNPTRNAFSLTHYIKTNHSNFPPVFIALAGKETNAGLNESINTFVREGTMSNIPVTFYNHPAGVHGFENQNDDERSKEIIRAMLSFLHAHLDIAPLKRDSF